MKNSGISMFQKTIKTELIKKKRSGIFTLAIILGSIIPIAVFFIRLSEIRNNKEEIGIPVNFFWEWISKSLEGFSLLIMLFIIIVASKIAQIDHKNGGWNLMETQPVSKFSIFFSKFIILLFSNILGILSFMFFSLLAGYIFTLIHEPGPDKIVQLPFYKITQLSFRIFAASLAVTALQYVLSVIISKYIWPVLIGFLGLLSVSFLSNFEINNDWNPYYFIAQTGRFPEGSDFGYWITYNEVLSLLLALIFLYIGFNWYRFKTFFKAFFGKKERFLKLTVLLFISGFLVVYTLKPHQQKPYHRTVISGTAESDRSIKRIYLTDLLTGDTIAKIPIENKKFHYVIKDDLLSDFYILQFGYFEKKKVYLGKNDSLNIKYQLFGRKSKINVLGTRISENKLINNQFVKHSSFQYYLRQNRKISDAEYYMKEIYKGWKKSLHGINTMRTVDNLEPRDDYKNRIKKEIAVFYIHLWNTFKKKHKALNPDKTYELTEGIQELEKSISYTDENLLTMGAYFDLIKARLTQNDKREIDENIKQLEAVGKLKIDRFRDKLMFLQLKKSIKDAESVPERDSLYHKYIGFIKTSSYRELLQKEYGILNRLSKGMPAPQFKVYNTDKQVFTNESFKGKFLVMDIWASWCAPCTYQTSYFESAALRFKDRPVTFVSVNIDMDENNWIIAVKYKSIIVFQVRAENINDFSKVYSINSIPRFILIDPDGNIISNEYSRPSDQSFSELLEIYLKKAEK